VTLPPATTRLILVRHGEPDESVRGRCYGSLDPGLSPLGVSQMRRAAQLLRPFRVRALYCSPRRRALDSARIVLPHLEPRIDARLSEIDFGAMEGLTYEDAAIRFANVYRVWMQRPTDVCFPEGESFSAMYKRVTKAIDALIPKHTGLSIAIVAHAGVNRIILTRAAGLPKHRMFDCQQPYGAVNVIDYCRGKSRVRLINATDPQGCRECSH